MLQSIPESIAIDIDIGNDIVPSGLSQGTATMRSIWLYQRLLPMCSTKLELHKNRLYITTNT